MPYVNQSRRPRHGRKLRRVGGPSPSGYFAVGDDLGAALRQAASSGLSQLQTSATAKGSGIISGAINSAGGAITKVLGGAPPAAAAAGMTRMTTGPLLFTKNLQPPSKSLFSMDNKVAGVPVPLLLAGGAGLAAILILKKRKKAA